MYSDEPQTPDQQESMPEAVEATAESDATDAELAQSDGTADAQTEMADSEAVILETAISQAVPHTDEDDVSVDAQPIAEAIPTAASQTSDRAAKLTQEILNLELQVQALRTEIASLQAQRTRMLEEQLHEVQSAVGRMMQEAVSELEKRKQTLQISVEQLERRQERIRAEMKTTFAGVSQDLAIRVQGFKDYLVGSLQDLAAAAEQLDLAPPKTPEPERPVTSQASKSSRGSGTPKFAEQGFQDQVKQIRRILDQYRSMPDYYGPPWQLRRTFEPIHAERISNWFFAQGGKGALRTMGSRLQNILIASAAISVLRTMNGDRLRTLVLANSPERLGEWRRGLQDCLGISRSDFGPEQGIVLFESPEALAQKADRLVKDGFLPLIVIDETEDQISLSVLQFPLWLAFAPDPSLQQNYF